MPDPNCIRFDMVNVAPSNVQMLPISSLCSPTCTGIWVDMPSCFLSIWLSPHERPTDALPANNIISTTQNTEELNQHHIRSKPVTRVPTKHDSQLIRWNRKRWNRKFLTAFILLPPIWPHRIEQSLLAQVKMRAFYSMANFHPSCTGVCNLCF